MLHSIYNDGPLSLQSNYARDHDTEIAALASRGMLTSLSASGCATRQWRLTSKGQWLINLENF